MFIEALRGSVRPVVTIGAMLATIGFIVLSMPIPAEWWTLLAMIVSWWFASRTKAAP